MNTNPTRPLVIAFATSALLAWSAAPAAAGGEEPSPVTVSRLVVAKAVQEREPVGAATEFSATDAPHLFAFVEIQNPTAEPTTVLVTWVGVQTGKTRPPYALEVGAQKRWRTWMRTAALKEPGAYEVIVTDGAGNELARTAFSITE